MFLCGVTVSLVCGIGCQSLPPMETKRGSSSGRTDKAASPSATNTQTSRETSAPALGPADDTEDTQTNPPYVDESEKGGQTSGNGTPPATHAIPSVPKIGVIVGPGFMRSFLAVGVLQEFHKARIPIQAMVGFEWGSLPAALYSMNGQANEVEWQMLKLNESSVLKKSLIRNQIESQSVTELQNFLGQAFARQSFDRARIPFECLTFDYKKRQYFWMKKGDLSKALSYCLASPPFSKPYLNNIGAIDLKLAVENLRQKGANYIVFINPLSVSKESVDDSFSTEAQVLWSLQQYELMKAGSVVDFVIDTSSAPYSVLDFASRRDMIRKGQEIGSKAVRKLSAKLGI